MSTIHKLSIQGIRSFGTLANDQQEIQFFSPLTLILGQNGCGKTTIIECLKYALTGEFPPGTNKGQCFVHDPNISSSYSCRGQVKLTVKNISNEKMTVIRTNQLAMKNKKPKFETLDSTLFFEDQSGDTVSRRINDVDAEMILFMGVSKAIINNVLFCHQEESSWPLDEGKKFKEKFDAIFGTTEYNKAIDKLIKMRKDQMAELKIKEKDLVITKNVKEQLEEKKLKLERIQVKVNALNSQKKEVDVEILDLQDKLEKLTKVEMEFSQLSSDRIKISTELDNTRTQLENLRSKIRVFDGSEEDLDKEIENFKEQMRKKKRELSVIEEEMVSEKAKEKKITEEKQLLEKKKDRIIAQRQKEQECFAERAAEIKKICQSLEVRLLSEDLECRGSIIDNQLKEIDSSIKAEEENINETLTFHEVMEQEQQKVIDDLRDESTKIETNINSKVKQKNDLIKEKTKEQDSLKSVEENAAKLKQLDDNIKDIDLKIENMKNMFKFDKEKQKITEKKQEILKLQDEFTKVDKRLDFLNQISNTTSQIKAKKNELERKDQEIKRLKNKHNSNIQRIFGDRAQNITTNYSRHLITESKSTKNKITEFNNSISKLSKSMQGLDFKRANLKNEIKKFEKELEEANDKIEDKCGSSSFEDLLAKSKENVEKYQREYSAHKSSESMFKNYISKISEDPCCPLCHKDLSTHEQTTLGCELSEKIECLPENIQKFDLLLRKERAKYESLSDLKPSIEKVSKFKKEIPQMKESLKKLETELKEVSSDLENQEIMKAEPESTLTLIDSMLGDMSVLDNHFSDKTGISTELETLQSKLPSGDLENIEEVKSKKKTINDKLNEDRKMVDQMDKKFQQNQDHFNACIKNRNDLKEKQILCQEGIQSLPKIKERIQEITKKLEEITSEITKLQDLKEPLKNRLQKAIKDKDFKKTENRNTIKAMTQKLESVKIMNKDIQRLTKELATLELEDLSNAIKNLKESLKDVQRKLTEKESTINVLVEKINDLRSQTSNQEQEERNLLDNKEYKILEQKKNKFQQKQDDLKKNMGDMDIARVQSQRKDLVNRRTELESSKGSINGQIGEVQRQIKEFEEEISQPKFKNAEKDYRKSFYDVEITKKVIHDLGQYRLVLDNALIEFHKRKMDDINKLIKTFWRTIYRGNDIDYIKIRTDADSTSSADKRRSFNYHVIQSKQGHEIEMRGRCSAGQRVLACLIIRMALAETFSVNCGVMTLDEPTTNLDKANILSLCDALNELILKRRSQHNFMLVVITHDEDFIQTLGKVPVYYRVLRNHEGKSEIRQCKLVSQ
ncbi:RAD50 family protein [Megaselia abdita]